MFDNYNNLPQNYVPSNTACTPSVEITKKPFELFDSGNNCIGYWWRYGDSVQLQIILSGEVTVNGDSIVYKVSGEAPTIHTVGEISQKAYNVIDLRSWTCTIIENNEYTWVEDAEFTYVTGGNKSVYLDISQYLLGKTVRATIYNFRYEQMFNQIYTGNPIINIPIFGELAQSLVKGLYYLEVVVCDTVADNYVTVIDNCQLLVK